MLKYYQTAMLSLSNTILKYNIILRTSLWYNTIRKVENVQKGQTYVQWARCLPVADKFLAPERERRKSVPVAHLIIK